MGSVGLEDLESKPNLKFGMNSVSDTAGFQTGAGPMKSLPFSRNQFATVEKRTINHLSSVNNDFSKIVSLPSIKGRTLDDLET